MTPDTSSLAAQLTEMTHAAMLERWQEGLVTPMSSTITTFAKTDGSWWTSAEQMWQRVCAVERNEQLDFHHERFFKVEQAKGPATNPWGR